MASLLRRLSQQSFDLISRRLWPLWDRGLRVEACRRTGLEDFGDPPIEPALAVLVGSLEAEASLGPLGRLLMRTHLLDLLETRLWLAADWQGKPGALESQAVQRPIFIVGMPRSGSTFLHELLAEDPDNRAPRVWEVMFPMGASGKNKSARQQSIRKAEFCLWWFRRLAPEADAVYPMRALTPHECVAIHSYTFLSGEFNSTRGIPAYEAFLRRVDLTPAYQWQKRFLQHLQWGIPGKRWVLKSPDHVYGLGKLFSVFPDAFIIQTHRNPVEVLKSSVELTRVLRGLYGPSGEWREIREREARVLAEGTERFIQFRDLHPHLADRFIDVKYTELVANPLATVRQIYARLDTPLTDAAADRMQQLTSNRSRYCKRPASADPDDYSPEAVVATDCFQRYCSRFGLPFPEADQRR